MDIKLNENERLDVFCEGIEIIQNKDGFSYGTDAVLLAAYLRKTGGLAVEFGSGTGIVSLLAEKFKNFSEIFSVEVQDDYFDLLSRNVKINDSKIIPMKKDVRELKITDFPSEVDVVFSNPPYMKINAGKENANEGKFIARHEVKGNIDDFCLSASKLLKTGGLFYCIYRPDRQIDLLCAMRKNRLEPKRITYVHSYINTPPCLMLVEAKKDAKASCFTTKPLILYKEKNKYSEEFKKIYSESEFDDEYKKV